MDRLRPRRSVLFLPASNPRAVAKARTLPCDVIVLDLEDAVGPEGKADARAAAVTALAEGFGDRETAVRVNGLDTPWGADDLAAMAEARPGIIVVPKVDCPDALDACAGRDAELWAMIETPAALLALPEIAGWSGGRLGALVLGVNDLGAALGVRAVAGREALKTAMALTVAGARAHGLSPIDGVFNRLDDPDGFAAECSQGRDFGFQGKSLIHPAQIEPCNTAFSPDAAEVAWARAVSAAFAGRADDAAGAIRVDGAMVERLHLEQARRILGLHEATGTP